MGTPSWSELDKELSDKDLWERYNQLANTTGTGVDFYRDALWYRQQRRLTRWVTGMTVMITVMTAGNVAIAALIFLE